MNNKKIVGIVLSAIGFISEVLLFIMSYNYFQNNCWTGSMDEGYREYIRSNGVEYNHTIFGAMQALHLIPLVFLMAVAIAVGIWLILKEDKKRIQ